MKLSDLKKTWDQLSPGDGLDEGQIREILQGRTGSLIERISRNVRIGFILLFLLIVVFVLDDFVFAPLLFREVGAELEMPGWLLFMSIFSNSFIVLTFLYFVIRYYRVRKRCDRMCDLRGTLVKTINTLHIYQKLFYLALIILSLALTLQFVSGMYYGISYDLGGQGIDCTEVPFIRWIVTVLIGMVVLIITLGGIYWLLRWGFRRLYGNYLLKLKQTLAELDEIDT